MSEVAGKHSINIRLEKQDFDYLVQESKKNSSNPTKLAHDLLRQIILIRKKQATVSTPKSPITQPTAPSTTPPATPAANNAGKEARTKLQERNKRKSLFTRIFSKK